MKAEQAIRAEQLPDSHGAIVYHAPGDLQPLLFRQQLEIPPIDDLNP
jgi:hypothetical protein